jgi:hypothetical protein
MSKNSLWQAKDVGRAHLAAFAASGNGEECAAALPHYKPPEERAAQQRKIANL